MSRLATLDPADYALPTAEVERLMSPALIVYLDAVRANLARMIRYLDGNVDRWRPHLKTVKIPRVFTEIALAGVRTFKCATTREAAELLVALDQGGFEGADLLVAYPLVGPALQRLGRLADAGSRLMAPDTPSTSKPKTTTHWVSPGQFSFASLSSLMMVISKSFARAAGKMPTTATSGLQRGDDGVAQLRCRRVPA